MSMLNLWTLQDSRGESAYFLSVNRNKRSVAIDFKKAEGRDLSVYFFSLFTMFNKRL